MATKHLKDLTKDNITQAFKKTVDTIKVPAGCKLVLVTADLYYKALAIAKECFVNDEPVGKAANVQWSDEYESLWLSIFKANLSILLVNEENGEIMGMRAITLIQNGDNMDLGSFKDDNLRTMIEFGTLDDKAYFDKYKTEEAFQLFGLGVAKKYRRRGLGYFLMQGAVEFLGNLTNPCYIKGEGTSHFSKRIFEKCGFDTVLEHPFDEYRKDGKVVFENTGEHKSLIMYGLCMSKNTS